MLPPQRSTSDHPILHGLSLTVVEAAVHKPDFRAALMEALAGKEATNY